MHKVMSIGCTTVYHDNVTWKKQKTQANNSILHLSLSETIHISVTKLHGRTIKANKMATAIATHQSIGGTSCYNAGEEKYEPMISGLHFSVSEAVPHNKCYQASETQQYS
jgi:hypothetical protein